MAGQTGLVALKGRPKTFRLRSHALARGLVAFWNFDKGGTAPIRDLTGHNRNLTIGGVGNPSTLASSRIGPCVVLGAGTWFETVNATIIGLQASDVSIGVVCSGTDVTATNAAAFGWQNGGDGVFYPVDATTQDRRTNGLGGIAGTALPSWSGKPNAFVIAFNTATPLSSLYDDGQLLNTGTGAAGVAGTKFGVGGWPGGGQMLSLSSGAKIYCAALWNRVLSAAEVKAWTVDPWAMFPEKKLIIPGKGIIRR